MLLIPALLALQSASTPHLNAARTAAPPVLDGRLDEPAWRTAAVSDGFTQKSPDEGHPPTERTTVRILYDDSALYVGIECAQVKAPVIARLTRRDRSVEADSVKIALDTRGDGKSAYEFSVNAAGVLSDGLYFNDTEFSADWDEIWEAKTAITKQGWTAELRIPLHALRYDARPVQSWGLQVRRYVSARQETDEWAFAPKAKAGEVSRYGRLDGIIGLKPRPHIEFLPFVVGKLNHPDPEASAVDTGVQPGFSAGLDMRWHVTPKLTLSATANPDFGQVEADPAVLNLGTFEVFFPEKRPFFLEGADTFKTRLDLLYTRRIGRTPGAPALPFGELPAEEPDPATIYGATKLVGDIGGRFSVGSLLAVTGRQRVEAVRPGVGGNRPLRLADPLTTFKLVRLRRELGERAEVGLIAMATNRLEPGGEYPIVGSPGTGGRALCPDGTEVPVGERCFHDAYVGGIDGGWRSSSGDYTIQAQAIASLIHDGPPRTFPDGTVIQSGDIAPAGHIRLAKEGGEHWIGEVRYQGHARKVDYNDLGFMRRQNLHDFQAVIGYRTLKPWWITRETATRLFLLEKDNLDFVNLERGAWLFTQWQLKNFWTVNGEIGIESPWFDDREVGDGTVLQRSGFVGTSWYVGTDPRAPVRAEAFTFNQFASQHLLVGGEAVFTFKILPQFELSLIPNFLYADGDPRYLTTEGSSHLFGRLRAQSLGLTLRSTYTFTPRLTLEAYAQAFLSSRDYYDYLAYPFAGGASRPTIRLDDLRHAAIAPTDNPDDQFGSFNANVVLRWEYRLGSTLYVVYTHGQDTSPLLLTGDRARLNFQLIEPRLAAERLLIKLSYWWG